MDSGLPSPPPAVIELRLLEERYGSMIDWVDDAMSAAARRRTKGFHEASTIVDPKLRQKEYFNNDRRYHERVLEIEGALDVFRVAYDSVKNALDNEQIMKYAVLIRPLIQAREAEELRRQGPTWKRMLEQREAERLRREERRAERLAKRLRGKSAKIERGDRDLPAADWSQAAVDEGAGGGAITEDRGLHPVAGRNDDPSPAGGEGSSPSQDDRVQPETGGLDREGPTEQGL